MAILSSSIVPVPPSLSPSDLHWRDTLLDDLALIEADIWDELQEGHPGARHRVAVLRAQGADRRQQLAQLWVRR